MKRKIDKTLKEVRSWKRQVAAKIRHMTPKQRVTYYNSALGMIPPAKKQHAA